MKKIIINLLFLFSVTVYSQSISPYFPYPIPASSYNKFETQITFLDFNYITNKIDNFNTKKLNLYLKDTKYLLDDGKGIIRQVYSETIASNRKLRKLIFDFSVFPINHEFVIKKLKIYGNNELATKFYVLFWSTTLNFENNHSKKIVSNNFLQDRINFYYHNGKSIIEINNGNFKNEIEFVNFFNKRKEEYKLKKIQEEKEEKLREAKKREALIKKREAEEELIRKERDTINNTKFFQYTYIVKKNNKKITIKLHKRRNEKAFDKFYNSNVEKIIQSKIRDKRNGKYNIFVYYKAIYNKVTKISIKVNYYEPFGLSIF